MIGGRSIHYVDIEPILGFTMNSCHHTRYTLRCLVILNINTFDSQHSPRPRAMGQSASALPSALPENALHCLRVADGSPASGHLEPFFDYLVDVQVDTPSSSSLPTLSRIDAKQLGQLLEENEGQRIQLKVYNAKSQRIRGGHPAQPS